MSMGLKINHGRMFLTCVKCLRDQNNTKSFSSLLHQFSKFHRSRKNKRDYIFSIINARSNQSMASLESNTSGSSEDKFNSKSKDFTEDQDRPFLALNKVAVVGKMTRYEFEKQRFDGLSEKSFQETLSQRGSDYNKLLAQHNKHLQMMANILQILKNRGIEYRICTRGHAAYSKETVEWADAIITAGGDGTFLSAASKIKNRNKPLIGINTDPERSEGHLCLPPKYSRNFNEALDKLAQSKFRWLYRQRIRTTMTGTKVNFVAIDNGNILQERMRRRKNFTSTSYFSADSDDDSFIMEKKHLDDSTTRLKQKNICKSLPILALNEVFIGESLASVPSYYELQIDGNASEKQKSSGICVSTGTGSTAWSYNICRMHSQSIQSILKVAASNGIKNNDDNLIDKITEDYANSFVFDASSPSMLYSIRDPMQNKVYSCENPNGRGNILNIRSRCWDATLCIDGDTSFIFNDGASATLDVRPEDALQTVVLEEDA